MMDSGRRTPSVARASRLARGWRLDRNPLRRVSDRIESVMLALLLAAFLIGAPLAALAGGGWAHTAAQRAQHAQSGSRQQVTAVVLTAVPQTGFWDPTSVTRVRWTAPDGAVVTGELPVTIGTRGGATFRVWTTRDGQLTAHPLSDAQVADLTALGVASGAAAVTALLVLAGTLGRWMLARRRAAAWDADWQATGPRWTARA